MTPIFTENELGYLLKALSFSAKRHSTQRRKDQLHSPYINHPIDVVETLWVTGGVRDTDVLIAALLHDTIEDTATTAQEIESLFGKTVCELVLEVTDDKSLPKAQRKRRQIEHSSMLTPGARQIKISDKICNIQDIIRIPPADWDINRRREYLEWAEQVVDNLRGANPRLEARFDDLMIEGRSAFNQGAGEKP